VKRFLVIVVCCVGILLSLKTPPERLAWNADSRVDWPHFKGMPSTTNGYAATSSTGLSQSYEIDGHGFLNKEGTTITAYFYPEFSWFRPKDTTAYLLGHERAHFDITEIYARKLRKRISEFAFSSNSKAEIKALYNQVEEERQVMQSQFDAETDHSRNREQEEIWHIVIRKMLEEYWVYTP
tara:strand:- start:3718 stop:4260 length:543 start_codon:yes stop_codon:yes gene_type:complete